MQTLTGIRNSSQSDLVISEIRSALLEAQAKTSNNIPTGVYFQNDRYTYFEGAVYNPSDPENLVTVLPSGYSFSSINLPSSTAQFNKLTRQLIGFTDPSEVVMSETGGTSKTISINRWGVIEISE